MRISLVKLELKEQNALLARIAEALERLAPPLPPAPPERKADLRDLRRTNPQEMRAYRQIIADFAKQTNTVPGSEAFEKAKREFEDVLRSSEGQGAVDDLLWNRIGKL